jgi:hypothetical protein
VKGWGDDDLTVGLNFPLHGKLGQGDAAAIIIAPAQDEERRQTGKSSGEILETLFMPPVIDTSQLTAIECGGSLAACSFAAHH